MRIAYTAVLTDAGEYRLGIAKEGETGYYAVREDSDAGGAFESLASARIAADAYNERLGLTKKEAAILVCGTMRECGS